MSMKLSNFFHQPRIITQREAEEYMNSHPRDSYLLVDVRQPNEYEAGHLPGAQNTPLSTIVEGRARLENKPIILYCRSGGRSRAASQWLKENGYSEIYDIGSHIMAWQHNRVNGLDEIDIDIIPRDLNYTSAASLAYAMEEGLQKFYSKLASQSRFKPYHSLLSQLARFENTHKIKLLEGMTKKLGEDLNVAEVKAKKDEIIECGQKCNEDMIEKLSKIENILDLLSFAMGIETQAFDFYSRLARQSKDPETKALFFEMADEEKEHLNIIAKEIDNFSHNML